MGTSGVVGALRNEKKFELAVIETENLERLLDRPGGDHCS